MQKNLLKFGLCLLISGCTTTPPRTTVKQDTNDHFSFKGITRNVAQVTDPVVVTATPRDPYLIPKSEKDGGGFFDCRALENRKRKIDFNGTPYEKLILADDYALKCPNIIAAKTPMPWKVKKTAWDADDEKEYGRWINAIGESKCNNVDKCMTSPANFLRSQEDMKSIYYSDCADFPYFLRAYFAYKKGLPFTFVNRYVPRDPTDTKPDRYNNGNIPAGRTNIPSTNGTARDFLSLSRIISDAISTGTFRMVDGDPDNNNWGDFYSPQISASTIVPGTTLYGLNGHAAVIYKVTSSGQMWFIDAHPGNYVSNKIFTDTEFPVGSTIYTGGNFKNFRPLAVINPQKDSQGNIIKGQMALASNSEIPGYSLEQYDRNNFVVKGQRASLSEWAKFKITNGRRLSPVEELKDQVDVLCSTFKDRVVQVQTAVDSGIHKLAHIPVLPKSIFGAEGTWETHSSPSADLRLRLQALELVTFSASMIQRYKNQDPNVEYNGVDLKGDLIKVYTQGSQSCSFTYQNSANKSVTVSLNDAIKRLPLISFDPYLCPELRWGASSVTELATCKDDATKREWYKYEQYMRNDLAKDQNAFYGYTLQQLKDMDAAKTVNNSPTVRNYDVVSGLQAL